MDLTLTANEARVLGCLLEKERTTPEYYPMTLNALASACNQKSNRDPHMHLEERDVTRALDLLREKKFAHMVHTAGARVPKHAHQLEKFFNFSPQDYAVLCLLLLRGPQTAGELRSRSGRLCEFQSPSEVETVLEELATREDGPFVVKLSRQPGRSASRYMHLLCGAVESALEEPVATSTPEPAQEDLNRIAALEAEVTALRAEFDDLKRQLLGEDAPGGDESDS